MKIDKVPANDGEALKSSLLGLFEKKRIISFYKFIENCELEDSTTWGKLDLKN